MTRLVAWILGFGITLLSTHWAHAREPHPQRWKPALIAGSVVAAVGGALLTVAAGFAIHDRVTYDPATPTMGTVIVWFPVAIVGAVHVGVGTPLAVTAGVLHARERRQLLNMSVTPILTGGQAVGAVGSVGFRF